ncbi:MAG: ribonuclease HII [Bacteroidales bacterium]
MLEPCYRADGWEAGCDEAGRGCIAGPVCAAAVILPRDWDLPGLNDSKKLSARKREALRPLIEAQALAYGVAFVSESEIDQINILNASIRAMHLALDQLERTPDRVLVDGNRFTAYGSVPHLCFVGGDARFASIAAASVLAKTHRDSFMARLHEEHPEYGWRSNAGYPTRAHRMAVATLGPTRYHRRSFRLLNEQMALNFF